MYQLTTRTPTWSIRHAWSWNRHEVDHLYDICLRTGADGEDATRIHQDPRLLGDIFVGPYLAFEPSLAFVLDDGTRAAGYALAARDTTSFEARCERSWWPVLRRRLAHTTFPPGSADARLAKVVNNPWIVDRAVVRRYPAHLHIDLLPAAQGGGRGRQLLERLLVALRERDVPGVHLGVSTANTRGVGFYQHMGFTQISGNATSMVFGLDL